MEQNKEQKIRMLVRMAVEAYASGFADRHLSEIEDPEGTINMKIHNIFIAALGSDIQYYAALVRSLDSSLGNMLERLAINIATLSYQVYQEVQGNLYQEQTNFIAQLLEKYKSHEQQPQVNDYLPLRKITSNTIISKRHDSDYYLIDLQKNIHYLIELKIGGDLDNKKARSEKEAILEQYAILSNSIKSDSAAQIKIYFATAYNRYGENQPWEQGRVKQFFAEEELLIGSHFWNFICADNDGYAVVIDEYKKNAPVIVKALKKIKSVYLKHD